MKLRAWWTRVRGSLRRESLEQQMEAEMRYHVDRAAERNVRQGMTWQEARREARLRFGSAEAFKEEARGAHRARVAESVIADARFAFRSLRRSPSFTVAAVLTVALGIGASTAVFSVVNAVLLRPLPVPSPEQFEYVGWDWGDGRAIPALTGYQFAFLRSHSRQLPDVATYRTLEEYVGDDTRALPVRGLRVTNDFFDVVGRAPILGREFDAVEDAPGGPAVAILGAGIWRAQFGGDRTVVGRTILLGGEPHTVVGVMPPEFRFPPSPDYTGFIVPLRLEPSVADEGHNYTVIARTGATAEQRSADLQHVSAVFRSDHPGLADGSFRSYTHTEIYAGEVRRTLWVLFGAVSLVLLIACANTATLLLVRASGRQREIAVRASIGAGPRRIVQQLLAEGFVLSVVAAGLGLLIGFGTLRVLLAASPIALPATEPVTLDGRVLAFAVAVCVVTGLVFGLAAAVPALRLGLQGALLGGSRGATGGGTRTRELLVFVETAVAVVLLAGAALLAASFTRLIRTDPGFEAREVVAVRFGRMPPDVTSAQRTRIANSALEQIRVTRGVSNATLASNLPLERGLNFPIDIAERPDLALGDVELRFVSPDYFATLGVPLRIGRDFDRDDTEGGEPVAIVNESFARHYWGEASPIGRTIQIGHFKGEWIGQSQEQTRVIGLVADMRELGLDRAPKPTVLVPRAQLSNSVPLLLVRVPRATPELLDRIRNAVTAEEPRLAPELERLSAVVARSVAAPRFRTLVVATFAGSALLLAGIGIYGVIASVVEQRRREIGVRTALGATRASIVIAVVRRCMIVVFAGAVAGAVGFRAVRRVLASMLFNTSAGDPRVLLAVIVTLVLAAALAAWIPARRAARVDPALALRTD